MRLSEAILLGDSLRERDPRRYLTTGATGALCGCGLGGAWLAAGRTHADWREKGVAAILSGHPAFNHADVVLGEEWPWLTAEHVAWISTMFSQVCHGDLTIEQLADYVRSIEPAEPSEAVCGEGPNGVTERAELLKV